MNYDAWLESGYRWIEEDEEEVSRDPWDDPYLDDKIDERRGK